MEPVVPIKEIFKEKKIGQKVRIRGWIWRTRSSGSIVFVNVRDASGIIQVTVSKKNVLPEIFSKIEKALVESSLYVEGTVHEDSRSPGGLEIRADNVEIVHSAEVFPIFKDQTEAFLLDNRHLAIRSQEMMSIFKVKAAILKGFRDYLYSNGFYEVTPPIITGNSCEGGSTLFNLDYFGEQAYLSQSAQLYLESLIFSLEKVWSLTPSFRAEKSRTRRHLAEFWMLEAEEAWVDLEGNMKIQEEMIYHVCNYVVKECENELKFLGRDISKLKDIKLPFRKITYEEALDIINKKGFSLKWGDDFGADEEYALMKDETQPIFVTHYPVEAKAFYMKVSPNGKTVENADLLSPEGYGEIIGGSERSNDIGYMKSRLAKENANLKMYDWYFDLRKYGAVPHSGFGIGIERVTRWITGTDHIRDTIPYPRTINRLSP
ncbi:MAG: asparagine--tRNA ligase [Thermoplasmata archaeon]